MLCVSDLSGDLGAPERAVDQGVQQDARVLLKHSTGITASVQDSQAMCLNGKQSSHFPPRLIRSCSAHQGTPSAHLYRRQKWAITTSLPPILLIRACESFWGNLTESISGLGRIYVSFLPSTQASPHLVSLSRSRCGNLEGDGGENPKMHQRDEKQRQPAHESVELRDRARPE
jgi:hypothetical protein